MKVRQIVPRRATRHAQLQQMQVLSLQPGDVLVVHCEGRLTQEAAARVRERVQAIIPGNQCLVLDSLVRSIAAVRPAKT